MFVPKNIVDNHGRTVKEGLGGILCYNYEKEPQGIVLPIIRLWYYCY